MDSAKAGIGCIFLLFLSVLGFLLYRLSGTFEGRRISRRKLLLVSFLAILLLIPHYSAYSDADGDAYCSNEECFVVIGETTFGTVINGIGIAFAVVRGFFYIPSYWSQKKRALHVMHITARGTEIHTVTEPADLVKFSDDNFVVINGRLVYGHEMNPSLPVWQWEGDHFAIAEPDLKRQFQIVSQEHYPRPDYTNVNGWSHKMLCL